MCSPVTSLPQFKRGHFRIGQRGHYCLGLTRSAPTIFKRGPMGVHCRISPGFWPSPMPEHYIKRILRSRVYDVAIETPVDEARGLSRRLDNRVLLKREDLQPVFSFKIRGAYNDMAARGPAELARGVLCASA